MSLREPPFPGYGPIRIELPTLGMSLVDAHPSDPGPDLVAISRADDATATPHCFARSTASGWTFEDVRGVPMHFDGEQGVSEALGSVGDHLRRTGHNAQYLELLSGVADYTLASVPGVARIDLGDSPDHIRVDCAARFPVDGATGQAPIQSIRCEYRRQRDGSWLPSDVQIRKVVDGSLRTDIDLATAVPRSAAMYEFRNVLPLFLEQHREVFLQVSREIEGFRQKLREYDRALDRTPIERERETGRGLEYA